MTSERISRPDPDISSFFAVPIARAVMADHESLCDELEALFLQKEQAGDVYRHPVDKLTAGVFSDPPINTIAVTKQGRELSLTDGTHWKVDGAYLGLKDGPYEFGVRPHHVHPADGRSDGALVEGKVLVAEISGSESTVHFDLQGQPWVCLAHCVHAFGVGETVRFHSDIDHSMLFSTQGDLVAALGAE